MCSLSCLDFGARHLTDRDVQGKAVLEVGARNVNGSLRDLVLALGPSRYTGLDMVPGPGVDRIGLVEDLEATFGRESADLVISTEMLEHVPDWRSAITNLKRVVRPGGSLLITTRSQGFPYHEYPGDFWRFEVEDFARIFADFRIAALERDPVDPGVFLKAVKPVPYAEQDLSRYEVYRMPEP